MKENLLENLEEFGNLVKTSSISPSFKMILLNEVAKMTSIPHLHLMTAKDLMELLVTSNFEKTEKMDGANWSCGLMNGKTYTKTKRGKPESNPGAHYKLRTLDWAIYDAFGRSIDFLNRGNFPRFYKRIEQEYKSKIIKQFNIKSYNGIGIFGEIFGNNQSNALAYDPAAIGNGALVIFGVKVDDGSPKGIELSTDRIGYEIIDKFVNAFDGVDKWRVYRKQPVGLKIDKSYIRNIKNFLKKHGDAIKSRKRDPDTILRKVAAKKTLEQIVFAFKKALLRQVNVMRSFIGDTDIEGVIIRNQENGAIAKIVDVDKFTALNIKNWAGRKAIIDEKKTLYKEILEKIVKSADIFVIQSKIKLKLSDYLEFSGKNKFDSLDELLKVIHEDAANEVQLKSAKQMAVDIEKIINDYIKIVRQIRQDTINRQKKPETEIDDFNFGKTIDQLDQEVEEMGSFIKSVNRSVKSGNAWARMIEFLLGSKTIEELVSRYVK